VFESLNEEMEFELKEEGPREGEVGCKQKTSTTGPITTEDGVKWLVL
jgi:hypothetical protein